MRSIATLAICTLLGAAHGRAQNDPNTTKERIEQEVLEKQRLMREGKVIRTNVRVTVRLRNGSRLKGVVKNERFIERVDGLSFVPADLRARGAGLRLWYYDNTNSYIFLPYDSILSHSIGEKLTDAEVRAIAERLDEERRAALAKAAHKPADGPDAAGKVADPNAPPATTTPQPEAGATKGALTAEQTALLTEYPPEDGWGLDRLREIETRKVTVGAYPDARSARFQQVFAQWNEAWELKRAQTTADPTPAPTPAPPGDPSPAPKK
jgi:hypothetical protein